MEVGSRRRLTTVGGKQLQVDNQEEEEEEAQVFPTRRSLRADAVDSGEDVLDQFERNDSFDEDFEDENIGNKLFKKLKYDVKPNCPMKYCTNYREGSCPGPWGVSSTCGFCIACSRPGYRVFR